MTKKQVFEIETLLSTNTGMFLKSTHTHTHTTGCERSVPTIQHRSWDGQGKLVSKCSRPNQKWRLKDWCVRTYAWARTMGTLKRVGCWWEVIITARRQRRAPKHRMLTTEDVRTGVLKIWEMRTYHAVQRSKEDVKEGDSHPLQQWGEQQRWAISTLQYNKANTTTFARRELKRWRKHVLAFNCNAKTLKRKQKVESLRNIIQQEFAAFLVFLFPLYCMMLRKTFYFLFGLFQLQLKVIACFLQLSSF